MNQDNYDKAALLAYLDAMVGLAQDAKEGGIENRGFLRELGADVDRQAMDLDEVRSRTESHKEWLKELNQEFYDQRNQIDKLKTGLLVARIGFFTLAGLQIAHWVFLAAEKYGWML